VRDREINQGGLSATRVVIIYSKIGLFFAGFRRINRSIQKPPSKVQHHVREMVRIDKTKICDTPRARKDDAQPLIVTMPCCPGTNTCRVHPILSHKSKEVVVYNAHLHIGTNN
jgi:hypothetical protein